MEEQITRQRVFGPCKEGEHGECAARVAQPHPRYLSGGRAILDIAECLCDCHGSEADAQCNCWVSECDAAMRFTARYGAHGLSCPVYRPSLDELDAKRDVALRTAQEPPAGPPANVPPLVFQVASALLDAGESDSYADLAGDIS